jgi:hypothetical protein
MALHQHNRAFVVRGVSLCRLYAVCENIKTYKLLNMAANFSFVVQTSGMIKITASGTSYQIDQPERSIQPSYVREITLTKDGKKVNVILMDNSHYEIDPVRDTVTLAGTTITPNTYQTGVALKAQFDDSTVFKKATSTGDTSSVDLTPLQNEVNAIETGAGLGTNGAYTADNTTNYLTAATSLKNADKLLDTQLKALALANTGDETGAGIKTKLEALSGSSRVDASAIKNLPTGGTTTINSAQAESPLIRSQQTSGLLPAVPLPSVINVSGAGAYNAFPDIMIDKFGRMQVYYSSGGGHASFDHLVKRAVSANGGKTWTINTVTEAPLVNCEEVHATPLSNGKIGMLTASSDNAGHYKVYFFTSSDEGETWSTPVAISDTYPTTIFGSFSNCLFEDNGTLYVTYYTATSNVSQESIFLIKSTDMGATWGSPITIGVGGTHDYSEARIARWRDMLVMYIRDDAWGRMWRTTSKDGFATFTTLTDATPTGYMACRPDFVFVGDMVHLLYRSAGAVMKRAVSYNGGITWDADEVVETTLGNGYVYSRLIYHNGLIIAAYSMDRTINTSADVRLLTWRYGPAFGLDGRLATDNVDAAVLDFSNIPTTNPGLGKLWSNSNVLQLGTGSSGGGSYDTNAQALFTASGISDTAVKDATNQLTLDWKAAGVWPKIIFAYLGVGGNATANTYNLKDATAGLAFSGTVTHNARSITWGGGYAHTGLIPDTSFNSDVFLSYYQSAGNAGIAMGCATDNEPNFYLFNIGGTAGGRAGWTVAGSEMAIAAQGSAGVFSINNSAGSATLSKNVSSILTGTKPTNTTPATLEFVLGALEDSGVIDSQSNATTNVHVFGHALTPTEFTAYYNAVHTFLTALGL